MKLALCKGNPSEDLKALVEDIADFPQLGIIFRDISPLLREHFCETIQQMTELFTVTEWRDIDFICGIESRGFILAAGRAALMRKGFVKIRKPGKLPGNVVKRSYGLEYGEDALEMHYGAGNVLLVDDVLATGGTLSAAAQIAQESGHTIAGFCCLINLSYLNDFKWNDILPRCLMDYHA